LIIAETNGNRVTNGDSTTRPQSQPQWSRCSPFTAQRRDKEDTENKSAPHIGTTHECRWTAPRSTLSAIGSTDRLPLKIKSKTERNKNQNTKNKANSRCQFGRKTERNPFHRLIFEPISFHCTQSNNIQHTAYPFISKLTTPTWLRVAAWTAQITTAISFISPQQNTKSTSPSPWWVSSQKLRNTPSSPIHSHSLLLPHSAPNATRTQSE